MRISSDVIKVDGQLCLSPPVIVSIFVVKFRIGARVREKPGQTRNSNSPQRYAASYSGAMVAELIKSYSSFSWEEGCGS